MSARTRLSWYTVACLSLLLTAVGAAAFGDMILAADKTYLTVGITAVYALMTIWIGWAIHTGRQPPVYWAEYVSDVLPKAGLLGTVIGLILMFMAAGDDTASLFGLATAFFTTAAGMVTAAALDLQIRIIGADA